jgi:glycosyltransferase involved in cell wall biosynthesis
VRHNVLQLIGSFNQGGSERQAVQLTRLLCESGHFNVFAATLDRSGPLSGEIERLCLHDVPEFPLTSFYNSNAVRQVRSFARYLRDKNIHVVHTHDFYTNIFGMAGAAMAGVPVRIASRRESAVRVAKQRLVERGAYRLAHRVVANCEEVRKQLIAEGVAPDKVVTLYNGLDLSRMTTRTDATREELLGLFGLPTDPEWRFVTIVANMRAHFWNPQPLCLKDHATFLRAARQIRETASKVGFVIAGEGELLDQTRAFASELGLDQDVFFVGRCERVVDLLSVSDVCVLSSIAEGFSNSILEYMAAGRPVVSTDVGGAREAIVDGVTGHLVPAGDHRGLAEAVLSILRDPDKARAMGINGRRVVEEKFSSEAQLERAQSLYDHLVTRKVAPPQVARIRQERV